MTLTTHPESMQPQPRSGFMTLAVGLLLALVALAVYVLTLAPSVGWGDQAKQQADAFLPRFGGAAQDHPLFAAAAHLMTRLPVGDDIAYRINLTAAVCGALTVLVVFLGAVRLLDRARLGGAPRSRLLFATAGAASLAIAHGFWLHAVTPAAASLAVLLFALVVWLWIRRLLGGGAANILLGTFLVGLAPAADVGLLLTAPLFLITGVWLLWRPPRPAPRARGRFRRAMITVDSGAGGPATGGQGYDAPGGEGDDPGVPPGSGGASSEVPGAPPDPGAQPPPDTGWRATPLAGAATGSPPVRRGPSLLAAVAMVGNLFLLGLAPLIALQVAELVRTPLRPGFAEEILPTYGRPVVGTVLHVARSAVDGRLIPLVPPAEYGGRLLELAAMHLYNFVIAAFFGLVGALVLLVRKGTIAAAVFLLVLFGLSAAGAVALPAADRAAAALPLAAILALWIAVGAALILRRASLVAGGVLAALVVGLPLAAYFAAPRLAARRPELVRLATLVAPPAPGVDPAGQLKPWRQRLLAPREVVGSMLATVPGESVLLFLEPAGRPLCKTASYLQRVEGAARDVWIEFVNRDRPPEAVAASLQRILDERLDRHRVFVAVADSLDPAAPERWGVAGRVQLRPHGPGVYELVGTVGSPLEAAPPDLAPWGEPRPQQQQPSSPPPPPDATTPDTGAPPPPGAEPEARRQRALRPGRGAEPSADVARALREADSLFAAGTYWQAAATYGSVLGGEEAAVGAAAGAGGRDRRDAGGDPRSLGAAHDPDAYARYAVALARSGMPTMSERLRRRYLELAPDVLSARSTLGHLFLEHGEHERAIGELEPVVEARPDDADAHLWLGQALSAIGRHERAADHLERALAISPDHPEALYELGRTLETTGQLEAAAEAYRRYLDLGLLDRSFEVTRRLEALGGY